MKAKNKIIIGIMSMALGASVFYASSSLGGKRVLSNIANTDPYTLTLDNSNKINENNLTTTLTRYTDRGHYGVEFYYQDVSTYGGGHCTINQNGVVRNKDVIHSIESIKVTFTTNGHLKFRTSYDSATWGDYCVMDSGYEYSLPSQPYYIEFVATDSFVNITQIKYSYSCEDNLDMTYGNNKFNLVTSTDNLIINDYYIIAASGYNYAICNTQSSTNRAGADIQKDTSDNTALISNDVAIFQLKKGSTSGTYAFFDIENEQYITPRSATSSGMLSSTTLNSSASYTISFSGNNATLTSKSYSNNNIIQYNSTSNCFACYSSGKQKAVCLYRYEFVEYYVPDDEVGFTATDSKANSYSVGDVYNNTNGLTVKVLYSDGSFTTLNNTQYTIGIKNSSGQAVNPGSAFTAAGNYTLTVSYKNYIPVEIQLAVGIVVPTGITASITKTDYSVGDAFEITGLKATINYNNGTSDSNIAYANFASKGLSAKLMKPSGVEASLNSTLDVVGIWKLRVVMDNNSAIYADININANAIDSPTANSWYQVTKTSELSAGSRYVIAVQGVYSATTTLSNNVLGYAECSSNSDYSQLTYFSNNTAIFTLSGSSSAWTLTNQNNQKLGASAAKKMTHNSGTQTWTISFDSSGNAQIRNTTTSYGYIKFMTSSPAGFTTNTSTNSGSAYGYIVQLYKETPTEPVYADEIQFESETAAIFVGSTKQMTIYVSPAGVNQARMSWYSSNTDVATVDEYGLVTGVSAGTASITCKYETKLGYLYANCQFTVMDSVIYSEETVMEANASNYSQNNNYDLDAAPSTGEIKLLVVPIWFTDSGNYISNSNKSRVKTDIEKAWFGTNAQTGWRSVKSYYEEESHGRLTITGVVDDWYSSGQASTYYNTTQSRTNSLVTSAVNNYFNKSGSDSRKSFDKDGNGYIDGVILIYGAPDYAASGGSNSNLWAYTFWLQGKNSNKTNPVPNVFFWASYDFMYGKKDTSITSYAGGDTSHCTLDAHTYIHEMGHMFGLEDYYDYSNQYVPAGGFSMQDMNVGGHDPYSCLQLGWANAIIPEDDCQIELDPFQDSGDVVILSPNWNEYNSPFDEYLLVEFYTPTGLNEFDVNNAYSYGEYPQGPTIPGIRLWHVDGRLLYTNTGSSSYNGLTTNPNISGATVTKACSNTYYSSSTSGYCSPLATSENSAWGYFNELQLIREDSAYVNPETFAPYYNISNYDLYVEGESFNILNEYTQFVFEIYFNDDETPINWSFNVESIGSKALISFYKN